MKPMKYDKAAELIRKKLSGGKRMRLQQLKEEVCREVPCSGVTFQKAQKAVGVKSTPIYFRGPWECYIPEGAVYKKPQPLNVLSQERVNTILTMTDSGKFTQGEIAVAAHCSIPTVVNYQRKHGRYNTNNFVGRPALSQDQIDRIVELTDQGCSQNVIAVDVGCSAQSVYKYQKRFGVKPAKKQKGAAPATMPKPTRNQISHVDFHRLCKKLEENEEFVREHTRAEVADRFSKELDIKLTVHNVTPAEKETGIKAKRTHAGPRSAMALNRLEEIEREMHQRFEELDDKVGSSESQIRELSNELGRMREMLAASERIIRRMCSELGVEYSDLVRRSNGEGF